MKRLRVHPDLCVGRQLCIVECFFQHEGAFGLALASLRIQSDEEHSPSRQGFVDNAGEPRA
jgi:hypothetical protein